MHATGDNLYLSPVAAFPRRGVGGLATRSKTHGINRKDFASVKQGRRAGIHCRRAGCRRLDAGRLGRDMARGFGGLVERFPMSADRGAKAAAGRLRTIADGFFDGLAASLRCAFASIPSGSATPCGTGRTAPTTSNMLSSRRAAISARTWFPRTRGSGPQKASCGPGRAIINSHMRTPALRRQREDAGESPPEFGQKYFVSRKRAYATESIYREWECFSKGEGSPPLGDSDSPIEDKFDSLVKSLCRLN